MSERGSQNKVISKGKTENTRGLGIYAVILRVRKGEWIQMCMHTYLLTFQRNSHEG